MSFSAARLYRKYFMKINEYTLFYTSSSVKFTFPHNVRVFSWRHVPTCLDSSSLQREYKVMNFLAKARASTNPSATNMISQISSKSGTTIAHGLKNKTYRQKVREFHIRVKPKFFQREVHKTYKNHSREF